MNNEEVKQKLQLLETELEKIRVTVSADDSPTRFGSSVRRMNNFLSTFQPLLTLIVAIVTLILLQMNFGFGTWSNYSETRASKKANKQVAEFYRRMGDRLVFDAEYDEAAKAYKAALELQANNADAIYGLATTQLFNRREGQKYADLQLIQIKLDYLSSFKDDANIEFAKCQMFLDIDDSRAEQPCREAIRLNPELYAAYVDLGYICVKRGDFDCAKENFQKAIDKNPNSAVANGNLGTCELLDLNTEKAVKLLETAAKISPRVSIMLDLGEAYRYSNMIEEAITVHRKAMAILDEKDIEKESMANNDWLINGVPNTKDDTETKRVYALASTIEIKKAVLHYALSVDYAVQDNLIDARSELEKAKEIDSRNQFGNYFVNRACSAANILETNPSVKLWLKKKSREVCTADDCGQIDSLFR